jgi:hypothetical protein
VIEGRFPSIRKHSLTRLSGDAVEKVNRAAVSLSRVQVGRPFGGKVREAVQNVCREDERPATVAHVPSVFGKRREKARADPPPMGPWLVAVRGYARQSGSGHFFYIRADIATADGGTNVRDSNSNDALLDVYRFAALEGAPKPLVVF